MQSGVVCVNVISRVVANIYYHVILQMCVHCATNVSLNMSVQATHSSQCCFLKQYVKMKSIFCCGWIIILYVIVWIPLSARQSLRHGQVMLPKGLRLTQPQNRIPAGTRLMYSLLQIEQRGLWHKIQLRPCSFPPATESCCCCCSQE